MPAAKWTAYDLRAKNLLTAEGFNAEYDQLKGVANGGLDRTSTSDGWVSRTYLASNALHKVILNDNIKLTEVGYDGNAYRFEGMRYEDYSGGWYTNSTYSLTGLKEGMLQIEFSCWVWMNKHYTTGNPKGIAFRLVYNGVEVARSGKIYTQWANPYLCAMFPISGSSGSLSLEWDYTPPESGTDIATDPQLAFGGGHILAIARWR